MITRLQSYELRWYRIIIFTFCTYTRVDLSRADMIYLVGGGLLPLHLHFWFLDSCFGHSVNLASGFFRNWASGFGLGRALQGLSLGLGIPINLSFGVRRRVRGGDL